MQVNKSYRILKYLNRKHGVFERKALAAFGWLGTAFCTQSTTLAAGISKDFNDDRFDLAFRKAARYARLFYSKLELFHIPFFDFTLNTTPAERKILAAKIKKTPLAEMRLDQLTDLLYILAKDIHEAIAQHTPADALIQEFYQVANQALKQIGRHAPFEHAIQQTGKQASTFSAGDFEKHDAVLALKDIADLLPLREWPWFIMSGTFLGQHREGGFLSHDYDIDLGIHAEDINIDQLLALLKAQSKFAIQKIDNSIEVIKTAGAKRELDTRTSIVKIIHENGIPIDIFIHYTDNNICWHGSVIHRWENSPFGLVQSELEGVVVNSPDNPDQYLTENYGDWRTPVTEFDCTTGTPNLAIAKNFKSLTLCLKRLAYFSAHDTQQAKKLLAKLQHTNVIASHWDENGNQIYTLELSL